MLRRGMIFCLNLLTSLRFYVTIRDCWWNARPLFHLVSHYDNSNDFFIRSVNIFFSY